jgi:NADP-dependent 3-hydroxy acid dehydrogenase YdfG
VTQLSSTRALVTGATSGLGRAMAAALTAAGARVEVAGREAGRAVAVASELGPRALGLALDVRDESSVRAGVVRCTSGSAVSTCW